MNFPTMAEVALADWRKRKTQKTIALGTIAKKHGATRDGQDWIFNDDTRIRVSGKGVSHKAEAMLP